MPVCILFVCGPSFREKCVRQQWSAQLFLSSYLHPSPQIYVAPPRGSMVHEKCTTWCIHVARWTKLGQNGLKLGTIFCFTIPNGPYSYLEKHTFDPCLTLCWSQYGPF